VLKFTFLSVKCLLEKAYIAMFATEILLGFSYSFAKSKRIPSYLVATHRITSITKELTIYLIYVYDHKTLLLLT